jgi:hypothetical protein
MDVDVSSWVDKCSDVGINANLLGLMHSRRGGDGVKCFFFFFLIALRVHIKYIHIGLLTQVWLVAGVFVTV